MYNLLVSGRGWPERNHTISADRVLEHSDAVLTRFQPDGTSRTFDIPAASALPTIFMGETDFEDPTQVARVGTLTRVTLAGRQYQLQYTWDPDIPPIPQSFLIDHALELGIAEFEFSRNHWAIKDVDLFQVLMRHANRTRQRPTVFNLPERPVDPNLVSVMMPFSGQFNAVYRAIGEVVTGMGKRCNRADDIWVNHAIIQDVVDLIATSKVVVCDLTGKNANVFYEAGVAHTLGKEVILLTQSHDDVPFDLRHLRYIHYLGNGEGIAGMAQTLQRRLEHLL